ncbi:LAGLIDADG family homing endonuclease [Anoxybacillus rupiensis]|uniref:LAGLIDADG family homing endonuclease n=1 Tax=Anoxybacteroides rupiense TaxID=311460 RepID=A0ABD5ISD3_9BACL|nr:LAGLIDADG family homing endonuclease [Anoxybacillus rupiensis]
MARNSLAAKINENTFDNWTYKNSWILGLMTSDGTFGKRSHPTQFGIYSTDLELLEAVKSVFESDKKIFVNEGVKGRKGKKPVGLLALSHPRIANFLKEIKAWGNKEQRNPFPNIPDEYKWSFVKGLFDGDGNFYRGMISIAGRRHLIEQVYEWICKQINKKPNKLYKSSSTNVTVYFQLCKGDSEKVYRLMEKYSLGTYNSTKYKKMQAYFEIGDGLDIL